MPRRLDALPVGARGCDPRAAVTRPAYSFRADPAVPAFPDERPLLVFDGVCVLCSGFARLVLRVDRAQRFRFAAAQSPLGRALFVHYGLDPVEFETNLLIVDGGAFTKMAAFAAVMRLLPWPWPVFALAAAIPRPLADWLYDRIARNRYTLFGRRAACLVPSPENRARFLG